MDSPPNLQLRIPLGLLIPCKGLSPRTTCPVQVKPDGIIPECQRRGGFHTDPELTIPSIFSNVEGDLLPFSENPDPCRQPKNQNKTATHIKKKKKRTTAGASKLQLQRGPSLIVTLSLYTRLCTRSLTHEVSQVHMPAEGRGVWVSPTAGIDELRHPGHVNRGWPGFSKTGSGFLICEMHQHPFLSGSRYVQGVHVICVPTTGQENSHHKA